MKCASCRTGDLVNATHSYFAELNNCMIIIKNVPCYRCNQCGEIVYPASIAERLDDFMDMAESFAGELLIIDYSDKVA